MLVDYLNCEYSVPGDKFNKLMTAEEKAKLYDALDFHESGDPAMPEEVG